jgi:hypothetical protein
MIYTDSKAVLLIPEQAQFANNPISDNKIIQDLASLVIKKIIEPMKKTVSLIKVIK